MTVSVIGNVRLPNLPPDATDEQRAFNRALHDQFYELMERLYALEASIGISQKKAKTYTGTGGVVLQDSPDLTGTVTAVNEQLSGTLVINGLNAGTQISVTNESGTGATAAKIALTAVSTAAGSSSVLNAYGLHAAGVVEVTGFSTTLRLNPSGGYVAINKSSPVVPFDVTGAGRFVSTGSPGGNNGLVVTSQTASGYTDGLHVGDTGAAAYKFIQSYGSVLALNPGGNNVAIGKSSAGTALDVVGAITASTQAITTPTTVAGLPAATNGGRAFVTDANTTLILGLGTTVTGGGANAVPVYSDGANWIYG